MSLEAILSQYPEVQEHLQDCFADMNPPNSPFNPAAPIFRPPLRQHQHSLPRGHHEMLSPHTPSASGQNNQGTTPTVRAQQNNRTSSTNVNQQSNRASSTNVSQRGNHGSGHESLLRRISRLEEDRSVNLEGFRKAGEAIEEARASLEYLTKLPSFESFEEHYQTMQSDLQEMERYRVEYGEAFETIGYELEELYAKLVVG